jgi:hypothetical protein
MLFLGFLRTVRVVEVRRDMRGYRLRRASRDYEVVAIERLSVGRTDSRMRWHEGTSKLRSEHELTVARRRGDWLGFMRD